MIRAMPDHFEGFGPHVFAWFTGLEQDNTKAYFTATRELYETEVRGGLEALLDELGRELEGTARVFRQQRDLRFTPDKTPYKTRTYGVVQGVPWASAGLYAELSARGLYAGSGLLPARVRPARALPRRGRRRRARRRAGRGRGRRGRTRACRSTARACAPRRAATRATIRASSCCAAAR